MNNPNNSAQHSEYRHDKVTMTVLMNDFFFAKGSPGAGDHLPNAQVITLDGNVLNLVELLGEKPMLLVFGSPTCPMTVSSVPVLRRLHAEFGESVEFVTLAVREAHPAEHLRQPLTIEGKLVHARLLKDRYGMPGQIVSDDIDGTLHQALDTKPNAAFLIDQSGVITFRSLWASDEPSLRNALVATATGKKQVVSQSSSMLGPLLRGLGYFHEVLTKAGPQAGRDMWFAAPPMVFIAQIAGRLHWLAPERRAPVTLTALAGIAILIAGILNSF